MDGSPYASGALKNESSPPRNPFAAPPTGQQALHPATPAPDEEYNVNSPEKEVEKSLQQHCHELDRQVVQLEEEQTRLKQENEAMRRELEQSQEWYNDLMGRRLRDKKEKDVKEDQIKVLREKNTRYAKEHDSFNETSRTLREEKDILQQKVDSLDQDYNNLKNGNSSIKSNNKSLKQNNATLYQDNISLAQNNFNLKRDNKSLRQSNNKITQSNDHLEAEKGRLEQQLQALNEQIRAFQAHDVGIDDPSENGSCGGTGAGKLANAYNELTDSKATTINSAVSLYHQMMEEAKKRGYVNTMPSEAAWNDFVELTNRAQRTLDSCARRIRDTQAWVDKRKGASNKRHPSNTFSDKMAEVRGDIQDLLRGGYRNRLRLDGNAVRHSMSSMDEREKGNNCAKL